MNLPTRAVSTRSCGYGKSSTWSSTWAFGHLAALAIRWREPRRRRASRTARTRTCVPPDRFSAREIDLRSWLRRRCAGSRTVKTVRPGTLSTVTRPPCATVTACTIARPRPVEPADPPGAAAWSAAFRAAPRPRGRTARRHAAAAPGRCRARRPPRRAAPMARPAAPAPSRWCRAGCAYGSWRGDGRGAGGGGPRHLDKHGSSGSARHHTWPGPAARASLRASMTIGERSVLCCESGPSRVELASSSRSSPGPPSAAPRTRYAGAHAGYRGRPPRGRAGSARRGAAPDGGRRRTQLMACVSHGSCPFAWFPLVRPQRRA
jgi:hypothetical protein